MALEWHKASTFFGYEIKVPNDTTYRKFVNEIDGLNGILKQPFIITGILPEFHNRMEGAADTEMKLLDERAHIIIGFHSVDNLTKMAELGQDLSEYVIDNPILDGLDLSETPKFYAGIDWFNNIYDSEDSSSEASSEDSSSEANSDDDVEDDDVEETDDSLSECSSDEDETRVSPEPFKSKTD